mgnify:CR=1 FL=1
MECNAVDYHCDECPHFFRVPTPITTPRDVSPHCSDENAYGKERLGAAIDRLGTEKLEADLATNDLLERKEEILAKAILE